MDIDPEILSWSESNDDQKAVNQKSGAVGVMQLRKTGAVLDYLIDVKGAKWDSDKKRWKDNKSKKMAQTLWTRVQKDEVLNREIGTWYVNEKIPRILNNWKVPDTWTNRLAMYNYGAGKFKNVANFEIHRTPEETRTYIARYMDWWTEKNEGRDHKKKKRLKHYSDLNKQP